MHEDTNISGSYVLNTSVSDVLLLSGDGVNDNNEIDGMRNYTSYMHVDDNYIKEDSYGVIFYATADCLELLYFY